ncbi:hypothetical protein GGR54DRAFT_499790 [Hypoxylon sp. NC1633]|nr:hypothetical protein GGR54DRAFT_499790 [Hypoxylon sp. NC1633]
MSETSDDFNHAMTGLRDLQNQANEEHRRAMAEAAARLAALNQKLDYEKSMAESDAVLKRLVIEHAKAMEENQAKMRTLGYEEAVAGTDPGEYQREMEKARLRIEMLDYARAMAQAADKVDVFRHERAMKEGDEELAGLGHDVAMAEANERMRMLDRPRDTMERRIASKAIKWSGWSG